MASNTRSDSRVRPILETLENRCVLASDSWPADLLPLPEQTDNDILETAQLILVDWPLEPSVPAQAAVEGEIESNSSDVDWYTFTLDRSASVALQITGPTATVLSLYNFDPDNFFDSANPLGRRLFAQSGPGTELAGLNLDLGEGTYFLAISGEGNRHFHPFLENSGYPGATGPYQLHFSASEQPTALPEILSADIQPDSFPNAPLDRSPRMIRLRLSGPLPEEVCWNLDLQVRAVGSEENLVAGYQFSALPNELQIDLLRPLEPGSYEVFLGAMSLDSQVVLSEDYELVFEISGIEGGSQADDTPGSARRIELAGGQLWQGSGAIGDDPAAGFFDANEVDVYSFQITEPGRYGFIAEVFSGRIGSPLNPGLSLFQRQGEELILVSFNDDTFNSSFASLLSTNPFPLATDSLVYAALAEGEYYLVVSEGGNLPDPFAGPLPFDAESSFRQFHGGFGFTTGGYLLNVCLTRDETPPVVESITPLQTGEMPATPPQLVVQFSEEVNLQVLAWAFCTTELNSVFIENHLGERILPLFVGFDSATNQASFLLPCALPPGTYSLHLSGTDPDSPITDLAGNPLAGNGTEEDFVALFVVTSEGRGTDWVEVEPNGAGTTQDFGLLAPFELMEGITITGLSELSEADCYQFQVLQDRPLMFSLQSDPEGTPLPLGTWLTLFDMETDQEVPLFPFGYFPDMGSQVNSGGTILVQGFLEAGREYLLRVDGWAEGAGYQLQIANANIGEPPPPLTLGAAPAIRLRLAGTPPPPPPDSGPGPPPWQSWFRESGVRALLADF